MKCALSGFLWKSLAVIGVSYGLVAAAVAQQTAPDDPIQKRFYSSLATAAQNATTEHTRKIGGGGGGRFFEVLPEGGLLVGFVVWTGEWAGHHIIRGVRPIFQTSHGRITGQRHGVENGAPIRVEAKEGYAVAAIEARGGDRLDGFEVLYWKIHPADINLDAEGSYKSEWIGGGGGHKGRHPLTSNGNPVIGIAGASGEDMDRLGLIYYDRH
ncbi:hypothetical protein CfE428DRAFT_3014 [Chthoniobacter flavus Ellin428]|uniref:Jacalin-type lectin domain-containing protein n=1 Tax=Chthoniobacter flavus Ellin428 TaxID=497964 RepID=B4D289_9BACT|nr:hypothetical protein [Chthoniobacter flavus]EDY19329.1 hypothetical protein CfE428DRAFT_3014 [Chthoniobacter flavus Ellin428]TCO90540.1 hypothetical protein EV701_110163 [Chthoniobacter flavus]